jgi:hypothetical protein
MCLVFVSSYADIAVSEKYISAEFLDALISLFYGYVFVSIPTRVIRLDCISPII